MRKLAFALVVGALGATSCYSPQLVGGFDCNAVAPLCPSGFECSSVDHKCYAGGQQPGDGGMTTIDGATPIDSGGAIDAGPALRPPVQVADGRNVALARNGSGARLAYEDSLIARPDSATAIRYVDIDSTGHVSAQMSLEANQTHQRSGLVGSGDSTAFFAWVETDSTDSTKQQLVVAGNAPPQSLPGMSVAAGRHIPYAVVAAGNGGFVFYADPSGSQLMAARITSGSLTPVPLLTLPQGHFIDEMAAVTSDDGASLIVAWRELTTPIAGVLADEYVRLERFTTSGLTAVWPAGATQIAHDQYLTGPGNYHRVRVAASTRAFIIGVTFEQGPQGSVNLIAYGNGVLQSASTLTDNTGFPTPALLPQSSMGPNSLTYYLSGISRTSGDRGPMIRRRVAPTMETLSPIGATVTNVIGVADAQENAYSLGQDGGDLGGDILAWGRPGPGWPDTGLILNSNRGQARAQLAAIARQAGGMYVAWVENGANEGQVFVQTLTPNAISP